MQDETTVVDAEAGIAAPVVEYPEAAEANPSEAIADAVEAIEDAVEVIEDALEDDGWEDPDPAGESDSDTSVPADAPDAPEEPRRPRGWLETDVERLLQGINAQTTEVPDGQKLTPHFVAKKLTEVEGLSKQPSTGAVAAVFDRWVKCGAAVMAEKPYAFVDFTTEAKERGIAALKVEVREAKKAAAAPAPVADDAVAE